MQTSLWQLCVVPVLLLRTSGAGCDRAGAEDYMTQIDYVLQIIFRSVYEYTVHRP